MKRVLGFIVPVLFMVVGLGLGLYPYYSQWWNTKLHEEAIGELHDIMQEYPTAELAEIRANAHAYNQKLIRTGDNSDYLEQLNFLREEGIMGRIKIPAIDVDIPIYHSSSPSVLRKGAGHMEETTLPVGGTSTHSAITAHRGLAESKLFTDLDKVGLGDTFIIEVAGDVLAYEVETVRIVKPTETEWLSIAPERDLVTLITCDPLGINTERMLVTGHRITPTPEDAIEEIESFGGSTIPWWALFAMGGTATIALFAWLSVRNRGKASDTNAINSENGL